MGKLIGLLILGAIAGGIYWKFYYKSPAYLTFLAFEESASRGDCEKLNAMVQDQAKEWIDDYCSPGGGQLSTGATYGAASAASLVAAKVGTKELEMMETNNELVGETEASDGSVDIEMLERPRHTNVMNFGMVERHTARLKKIGDTWKLVAYKAERVPH